MDKVSPQKPGIYLGAAYYPEHWPESRWDEDIRLMQAAGVNVVRMAEFAWADMEPADGQFNFGWLDRVIEKLGKAGISSVLGTPTAAPPAWLMSGCPDIFTMDENGRRVQFGNRCHYCVTSPDFHAASRSIVTAMAEHFGPNPNVIGWQFDNEFNRVCYCDRCRARFQAFLAERYGSLEALNSHWTTAYWSQTYNDWAQIPIPIGGHNPGLMLEFMHFTTLNYRRFQRLQLDCLRPYLREGVFTTHNFMGWFDGFDHYQLNADLDLASWDWYIGKGHHDYLSAGAPHDLTRGFKRRNFWVMETQPGNVNWSPLNNVLNKGEGRAMAWHAIAHGADAILYWQWRSALNGQEQYHGTLVDQSGQPRLFYQEVSQLGQDLQKVGPRLAGSSPQARVALLNDYDSRWSIHWQRHNRDFDYVAHFLNYYRPLAAHNIPVDILSADTPFAGGLQDYRLVIAPALLILTEARTRSLLSFVEAGGHLVLTLRSGMKDEYNALLPLRQPGTLADAAGIEVEEYYALLEPVPVAGSLSPDAAEAPSPGSEWGGTCTLWAERLKIKDETGTQVLASFGPSNGWLDGQPAVTSHTFGRGRVTYIGAWLDEASQEYLINQICTAAGVSPVLLTPPGIEARTRTTPEGEELLILINHTRQEVEVSLPWPTRDLLHDLTLDDNLLLPPYEVALLEQEKTG